VTSALSWPSNRADVSHTDRAIFVYCRTVGYGATGLQKAAGLPNSDSESQNRSLGRDPVKSLAQCLHVKWFLHHCINFHRLVGRPDVDRQMR
jgi:hypothetical protein